MTTAREELVFSDAFDDALDPEWTWLREHPGFWRLQDGLEIRVEPGVADTVQNALLRPAPDRSAGTWAIEVTVSTTTPTPSSSTNRPASLGTKTASRSSSKSRN